MKTLTNQQFERNKYRVLNQIEEILEQPLTPQVVKCLWKIILEENKTTFTSRTKEDLNCFDCKGYEVNCRRYME